MLNSSPKRAAPLRVLHVITPTHMGGAETLLARLLQRAQNGRSGHSCVTRASVVDAELRAAGVTFETLAIGGKANLLAPLRLQRAALRYQADVLHSHLSSASWWCGWLEQLGGPPSLGHVHGFTSALWHRRQSHLIACSEAVKQHLVASQIPAERITVIHCPVDPDDMRPTRSPVEVRAELGVPPDAPIVGTFAHLSPKKGHRELVQAAALVLRRMPAAQFWCFGEGPLRPELEHTAHELGIADRFKLFGFRRDVPDLMRAIDVMCLPSHREPFGLAYVEAALAEKPVIACNAGGAPEIIAHHETGLLVPPPLQHHKAATGGRGCASSIQHPASNIEPLADALLTLLDNRDRAAAMGRRGRELALDRFDWSHYLARLNDAYECVLAGQPAAAKRAGPTAAKRRQPSAVPPSRRPGLALTGALRLAFVLLLACLVTGWAKEHYRPRALRPADATITYEVYTDRDAFERRLAGATRWVDFDDVGTGRAELAAFEPTRYASRGIIIKGVGGQYVARTVGLPAEVHAVSQPNVYAPGPVGANPGGNRTDVEFIAGNEPALVCGFGLNFVDVDSRDEGRGSIELFDQAGQLLVSHQSTQSAHGAIFRGVVAVDADGAPVPVVAAVRLTNGSGWPGVDAGDCVAMDDFVYSVPRPYRH